MDLTMRILIFTLGSFHGPALFSHGAFLFDWVELSSSSEIGNSMFCTQLQNPINGALIGAGVMVV